MCAALTLPPDLSPDEQETVERFRERAEREARERAALVVRVDREVNRLLRKGMTQKAAFSLLYDDGTIPLSPGSIEDAYRRRKAFAV